MDDKGIHGNLGSLVAGIKLVGNNTSEILAMIMNTGNSLKIVLKYFLVLQIILQLHLILKQLR